MGGEGATIEVVIPGIDKGGFFKSRVLELDSEFAVSRLILVLDTGSFGGLPHALNCYNCLAARRFTGRRDVGPVLSVLDLDHKQVEVTGFCLKAKKLLHADDLGKQVALERMPCATPTPVDIYLG